MKRIFIGLIIIIVLVGGFILALPSLFSSDVIWAKVNPILEQQIGRKISVAGERKLSLYPNIALVLGDVEIGSNIAADAPLASLETLRISVNLLALFSGDIQINELALDGADINLIVDANGQANWANKVPAPLPEQSNDENDPLGGLIADSVNEVNRVSEVYGSEFDLSGLSIQNFTIRNSRVTYEDQTAAMIELVEAINLNIQLANQNKNLSLDGDLMWQNQNIQFKLNEFEIDGFLNHKDAKLDFAMQAAPLNLNVNGQLSNAEKFAFDGNVGMQSPSLHQLATWLKIDLSSLNDSSVDLKSNVDFSGNAFQFKDLAMAAFGSQMNGTLNVSLADKPNIYGKLVIDQVNYNQIIPASGPSESAATWSEAPISLSFLAQFDSNVELTIGNFKYDGLDISDLNGRLTIRESSAIIPLQMQAFGGQILADISANLGDSGAAVGANVEISNIQVGEALVALEISDKLTALTSMNVNVSTSGSNMAQFMNRLNGNGQVVMADGVIKGIAIADALAPEIANIDLSLNSPEKLVEFAAQASKNLYEKNAAEFMSGGFGQNVGGDKQTKFVEAIMNFNIENGVLNNEDLQIKSESISIYGAGKVDLGAKSLNYRIVPKLLRQTEDGTAERMTIPALISGPWSDPNVEIDYAYAIENSSTLKRLRDKAIEKIAEKVTDKIVETITEKVGEQVGEQLGEVINNQLGEQVGNLLGVETEAEAVEGEGEADAPESGDNGLLDASNLLNGLLNTSE